MPQPKPIFITHELAPPPVAMAADQLFQPNGVPYQIEDSCEVSNTARRPSCWFCSKIHKVETPPTCRVGLQPFMQQLVLTHVRYILIKL